MNHPEDYITELLQKEGIHARYSGGKIIYKSGEIAHFLFYIRNGLVYFVETKNPDKPLFTVSAGNILGLQELMNAQEYKQSAITGTNVSVLKIDKNKFDELFRKDIKFRMFVVKKMSVELIYNKRSYE